MSNSTQNNSVSLEEYLRQRDDIGKLIIHDLVAPMHNLLSLTRDIQSNPSDPENSPSAAMAVTITQQVLEKVLNLYTLSFDNTKLFVISIFDVHEMIGKLVRNNETLSKSVRIVANGEFLRVGDAGVTRIWINQVLQLLQDRFGNHPMGIDMWVTGGILTVSIVLENIREQHALPETFIDTVTIINKLSALLDAQIAMDESSTSVAVTLKMTNKE